jgi:DNA-binding LytR/AlgR family response regulator
MRIAIVEDEAPIARRLERAVRAILGEDIEEVALLSTLAAALEHVRSRPVDLVFLDLNLEGRDGFQLLTEAVASRFRTVVVSAYEEQAIRAFEVGVTDFVPKPWNEARLRLAVERAVGRAAPSPARASKLAVHTGGGIELIPLEHVVAIGGADDYSELHLADGSKRLHQKTLAALEELLPAPFLRVHRSWIVHLAWVRSWAPTPGGRATLVAGEMVVPVGRTYRRVLNERVRNGLT